MLNFGIFGFWGFFLGWFVFAGDAISTLSIKGTKFYDASGNQVFFKGLHSDCPKERKRLTGGNRNCVSAVAAGSIGEYHPMSTRCPINANARRKCHPMYCAPLSERRGLMCSVSCRSDARSRWVYASVFGRGDILVPRHGYFYHSN